MTNKFYRIAQAMPGTDGYGHFVLCSSDKMTWTDLRGINNHSASNPAEVAKAKERLESDGYEFLPESEVPTNARVLQFGGAA